ncbi:MAG: hypothetical protein IPK76_15645, partial [Lewinellaceae bacterium]|nr:hypothetical protein [Lewinellaceae bacterium]
GYAVVLGQSGATDPVRLARYKRRSGALSNIITSNTTGLTDFGTDYLSIKVTYTPTTNTWELFVRNDGATAFADPASGSLTSQGTAVDATHTGSVLALMGAWWQGSTAAAQTAFFDNTTVTVCPFPTITLGTSPSVCSGITSTTLPYSATTNSPTQYSINFNPAAEAQGFEDVVLTALPGGSIPVVVPGDADPGVYNGVLTVQNDCGSTGTANFTVTISALGTASVGADQTTCVNGIVQVAGTVGGSSNAGTWSDGGAGGVFSNASGLATYYTPPFNNTDPITLTLTSNGPCPATDDLVVTYGPLPPLTLTAVGPANATCGEEIVITIEATNGFVDISSFQYSVNWDPTKFSYVSHSTDPIGGAPPGVGAFNTAGGILTSAWFDPSGSDGEDLADGTALLTITLKALVSSGTETVDITGNSTPIEATNSQFCVMTVNTANTQDITLNPIVVTCPGNQSVCSSALPLDLTTLGATPAGGVFSGTGVSGTDYNAAPGTTNTVTYTYTDGDGCSNSCTFDITIYTAPELTCPNNQAICVSDLPLDLSTLGALPLGGVFSGTGVSGTSYSDAGGTTNTVTYTVTDGNGCVYSCAFDITIFDLPEVNCPVNQTVCESDLPLDLTTLDTEPGGGTFSGTGVSGTSYSAAGGSTNTVTYSYTDGNGCSNFCTFDITVNAAVGVTCPGNQSVCEAVLPLDLTTLGATPGGGAFSGTGVSGTTYTAGAGTTNTVTYTYTDGNGCTGSCTFDITVNATPAVNCPVNQSVCTTALPLDLTALGATPGGGTFTGIGVSGTTYTAAAGTTNTVTYTYSDGNDCTNSCTFDITVYDQPAVDCPDNLSVCTDDLPLNLAALGANPGGGTFSGTGVSGTTYTATAGTTNTVTYTYIDGNGCSNSCTFDITVNALPAVNCPENQIVCEADLPLDLTALGASPGSGTFSGAGVSGTTYTALAGTTNTVTYTYVDGNGCSNSCTFDITVNATPVVDCPDNQSVCTTALPLDLTALGATPGGGTFSGTGVSGTTYTAAAGTTNTVTYTYTANGCTNSCTFDISVYTQPAVDCPTNQSVCTDDLPLDLTALGATPGSGTFSGTGVSGTTYTAGAGTTNTVTYTYTDGNGCSNSCTFDITVNALPAVNCPENQIVCEADLPLDLAALGATPGGGTFSGTGVSGTTYTAAAGTTNTVTYSYTDGNGCVNSCTFDITVNATPVVDCPDNQLVCTTALPLDLTALGATPGGGAFTGTGVSGTTYTAAAGTTNTVTYSYTANNCTNSCTFDITVYDQPAVNCPTNQSVCESDIPLDLTSLGAAPGGGTFTGTGVTGTTYTAAAGTTNTITYTYTDGNGCTNSCTFDITVNAIPSASINGTTTICAGGSTTLTATGGGTYNWSTNETTESINVSPATTTPYSVIVTNAGCSTTVSVTVTVGATETADAGDDQTTCVDGIVKLTGTVGGAASGGT